MSVKIKIKELFKNNKPIVVALVLIFFLASGWSILNSQKSLFSCSALAKENSGTSPWFKKILAKIVFAQTCNWTATPSCMSDGSGLAQINFAWPYGHFVETGRSETQAYTILLSTDSEFRSYFSSPLIINPSLNPAYRWPNLPSNTSFWWQVVEYDSAGVPLDYYGPEPASQVTTPNCPIAPMPGSFTLSGAAVACSAANLSWTPSSDTDGYKIFRTDNVPNAIPLHRLWNPLNTDHLSTTDPNEGVGAGYIYEGITGYIYQTQQPDTVPLYRFWSITGGDHFLTQDPSQESLVGYIEEAGPGYVFPTQQPGTLPLHRLWNPVNSDHMQTLDPLEGISSGYQYEKIIGYIYPTSVAGWQLIATVDSSVTSYNNTGLSGLTTYYYYVEASNIRGTTNSNTINLATPTCVPSAINLSKTDDFCSSAIIFSWQFSDPEPLDSQSGYQIQIDNNSNFDSPEVNPGKVLSSSDRYSATINSPPAANQLAFNTTYYWRVKVLDQRSAESDWAQGSQFATPLHRYPTVDFSFDPQRPAMAEQVRFTDQSFCYNNLNMPIGCSTPSYFWNFGDGETESAVKNPRHTYFSPGTYNVNLRITDSDDFSCAAQKAINIDLPSPIWREILPF